MCSYADGFPILDGWNSDMLSKKLGGTEFKWDTSAFGLCWRS
jgi:hypothetical protein